jgi:DNA-binding response OmpR family regulator
MSNDLVPLLRIRHPDAPEIQIEWHRDSISIGRDQQNDIVVNHPLASRRHAVLERDEQGYAIRDLQSTNGTYVNGEVIPDMHRLHSQDMIIVGNTEIVFIDPDATQKGELPFMFAPQATQRPVISDGDIVIDDDTKSVLIHGEALTPPLTVKEFQLLLLLYRNQGRVVNKEEIANGVWDYEVYDFNAIDALIYRVRQRIEQDPAMPKYLVTVRGFGYKLIVKPEK